ncbi:hypothetical protein ARZXY2_1369 [Arthrobacter sp. ZXY-2]|nr:hypothetical protein ARZXY2_1369 [Arthrobacter sp. ZXY-2]
MSGADENRAGLHSGPERRDPRTAWMPARGSRLGVRSVGSALDQPW